MSESKNTPLMAINNLAVSFHTRSETVRAVDGVSLEIYPGETVGIVGESGSGKSVTMLSAMRLLPSTARVKTSGQVLFQGQDMLRASQRELRNIRGRHIALIPQDPMTCLDPVLRVGAQLREALRAHQSLTHTAARQRAIELLETVGLPEPEQRYAQFPHEYSGGMRQRAMIAMGIANRPALLIADEPTTALDVTIQAQIMDLLKKAQRDTRAGLALITHDLGLIAEMADRVVVMYAGRVVESGDVHTIFGAPRHPYTHGLLASLPQTTGKQQQLHQIPGNPPDLADVPPGCPFHPRCQVARGRDICRTEVPALLPAGSDRHRSACHFSDELGREADMSVAEEPVI